MARADGKVAMVSGEAAGLGRAAAFILAKEGAKVAVVDVDDETGPQTVADIQARGGAARYWHMDVSKSEEVKAAAVSSTCLPYTAWSVVKIPPITQPKAASDC